jgi:hypothetical protein
MIFAIGLFDGTIVGVLQLSNLVLVLRLEVRLGLGLVLGKIGVNRIDEEFDCLTRMRN